jgi:hypothetical protein
MSLRASPQFSLLTLLALAPILPAADDPHAPATPTNATTAQPAARPAAQARWVYCPTNLQVDANADKLIELIQRASKAGYTGALVADSKFAFLGQVIPQYFKNLARVKQAAADANVEIIPEIFDIGYSNNLLENDPNLAEGLPIRDDVFVVKDGEARPDPSDAPVLKGGAPFDLARWDWHDPTVTADPAGGVVMTPDGHNARIVQKLQVKPFHQYHLAVTVRTIGFHGTPQITVLAGDQQLNYANLGVPGDSDWTVRHAVFNSLDHTEVNLYLGCWDGTAGTLAWKDAHLDDAGLLNLVRRDGAPLTVRGADGKTLVEGHDFDPVADPHMGNVPWNGSYEVWHPAPAIHTTFPDGTKLTVSAYHAITVGDGQVMICPSEPKTIALLTDEAKRVHAAWGATTYFMAHDEIRVLDWDESCAKRKLTPGEILADNVHTCLGILRATAPGARIVVWSDMFDPGHNAHDHYYLVNGDLAGSWNGLDKDVTIALWNFDKRDESAAFFAHRGNPLLIAGYYDADPAQIRDWLAATDKVGGAFGVMYTTWANHYGDLERFAGFLPPAHGK